MTQPLSPAAQAVLSAFLGATPTPGVQELAAALRVAAAHLPHYRASSHWLEAIATELEGMQ